MNWQAEFLDNPEIRLTFDHFPFFQKQGIMENRFSFDYQHYDSSEGMPAGDRELVEEARRAVARARAFIPNSVGARPSAKGRFSAAATRRARCFLRACAPNGRCCSMPERAMPTIQSRRWPLLRSRPSGSAIPADSAARCCSMERRQRSPIRIIMSGAGGATVVDSAVRLLPFTFQL